MPNPHDQVQQNTVERQERPRPSSDQQVSASVVQEAYSPANVRAARSAEPANPNANMPGQQSDDCFGRLFPQLDLNSSLKGFEIGESNYQQVGDSLKCGDTTGARHHLVDAMRNESQGLSNLTKWEQQNQGLLAKDPYSAQELSQVEKSMRQSLKDGAHAYEELMEGDTCGARQFADSAADGATDASRNLQTAKGWLDGDTAGILANLPPITSDGPPPIPVSPCGGDVPPIPVSPCGNTTTAGSDGGVIPAPPQAVPPELPPAPPAQPLPPYQDVPAIKPPCQEPPDHEPPALPAGHPGGYHPLPHPGGNYHPNPAGQGGDGHGVAPAPPGHPATGSGGDGTVITGTNTAGPLPPGIKPGPDYDWQQAKQRGFLSHHDSGSDFDNDLRENVAELMTMGYGSESAIQMVATHENEEGGGGRSIADFLNGWNPRDYHPPVTPNGAGPGQLWAQANQAGFMAHHDSGSDFDNDLRENLVELKNMGFNPDQAMQMVSLFENEEGGHDRSTGQWLNGMNPYS